MRFMSLRQRSQMLWDKFAFKMGSHSLGNLYKREGIGFRFSRPQARKYLTAGTNDLTENTQEIRRKSAEDLLHLLCSNEPVLFIDECTIQS